MVPAPKGYHWMKQRGGGYKLMKNPSTGYKQHKGSSLRARFNVQKVHDKSWFSANANYISASQQQLREIKMLLDLFDMYTRNPVYIVSEAVIQEMKKDADAKRLQYLESIKTKVDAEIDKLKAAA